MASKYNISMAKRHELRAELQRNVREMLGEIPTWLINFTENSDINIDDAMLFLRERIERI